MSETALSPATPVATAHRAPTWRTDLVAMTLFLGLGLGLILRPYATGQTMPGDLGDARFNFAVLEFFYRTLVAVLHGHAAKFLNAPFFYPWPDVTNFGDTFWGDGETYALVRALGVGPLESFQAWVVAGFALTYFSAFVSFRKLGLCTWGAAAGAFLFTFPLPMTTQIGHAQLVYRLWVPPAVVAVDRFSTRASLCGGAAAFLFVALQLLASIYLGLFLCLLLASCGTAHSLVGRSRVALPNVRTLQSSTRTELVAVGAMLVAGAIVLATVVIPYRQVQLMYGVERSWDVVAGMVPRPGSYLLAGASRLWPNLSRFFPYPLVWEHQIFPGLAAIIPLAWFGISKQARRRYPLAAVMMTTLAILVTITLYVHGHSLYWFVYLIPGFNAIRAVTRIILVMMMPLAVLFGLLIDDLVARKGDFVAGRFAVIILCGFLVTECALVAPDSTTRAAWQVRSAALAARLPKNLSEDTVLAVASPPLSPTTVEKWVYTQIDAEVAAVMLNIRTLNGYSGNAPPGWKTMTACRDIGDNILTGRHFLADHGLPVPAIAPEKIVAVGFGLCDPPDRAP